MHKIVGNPRKIGGPLSKDRALEQLAAKVEYDPQALADYTSYSLRKLERLFKRKWQCTPRDWLRMMRMKRAANLLDSSDSIKWVSYELGFKQPSHFCREFKLHYGVSASEFLKNRSKNVRLKLPA